MVRFKAIVRASGLTALEKLMLFLLFAYADGTTGECWPSVSTLAANAGLSRRTVGRILKSLEARGVIEFRRESAGGLRSNGQGLTHLIRVRFDVLAGALQPTPTSDAAPATRAHGDPTNCARGAQHFAHPAPASCAPDADRLRTRRPSTANAATANCAPGAQDPSIKPFNEPSTEPPSDPAQPAGGMMTDPAEALWAKVLAGLKLASRHAIWSQLIALERRDDCLVLGGEPAVLRPAAAQTAAIAQACSAAAGVNLNIEFRAFEWLPGRGAAASPSPPAPPIRYGAPQPGGTPDPAWLPRTHPDRPYRVLDDAAADDEALTDDRGYT